MTSTIYALAPGRSTLWGGASAGISGIHRWTFTPVAGGTHVVTEESWAGDPVTADPQPLKEMLEQSLERWLGFLETAATRRRR